MDSQSGEDLKGEIHCPATNYSAEGYENRLTCESRCSGVLELTKWNSLVLTLRIL